MSPEADTCMTARPEAAGIDTGRGSWRRLGGGGAGMRVSEEVGAFSLALRGARDSDAREGVSLELGWVRRPAPLRGAGDWEARWTWPCTTSSTRCGRERGRDTSRRTKTWLRPWTVSSNTGGGRFGHCGPVSFAVSSPTGTCGTITPSRVGGRTASVPPYRFSCAGSPPTVPRRARERSGSK